MRPLAMAVELAALDATAYSAIAVAVATVVLVCVTGYYAWQTRETVIELRRQREVPRESARHALLAELRQLIPLLEARGAGSNHIIFPTQAWAAAVAFPGLASVESSDRLFAIYAGIYQQNATAQLLLSSTGIQGVSVFDSIALTRRGECEKLARDIRAVLGEIETGAPPTEAP